MEKDFSAEKKDLSKLIIALCKSVAHFTSVPQLPFPLFLWKWRNCKKVGPNISVSINPMRVTKLGKRWSKYFCFYQSYESDEIGEKVVQIFLFLSILWEWRNWEKGGPNISVSINRMRVTKLGKRWSKYFCSPVPYDNLALRANFTSLFPFFPLHPFL